LRIVFVVLPSLEVQHYISLFQFLGGEGCVCVKRLFWYSLLLSKIVESFIHSLFPQKYLRTSLPSPDCKIATPTISLSFLWFA